MENKFAITPPSKTFAKNFIKPFKLYFDPQFIGIDELDVSRPALYVTNHSVMGVLDGYPFAIEIYIRKGIVLRTLADRMHFKMPYWRDMISEKLGIVEASRENCEELMRHKESIIVFPGGARETFKKKGEEYTLKWNDRTGFVRMAMKHGYDIIPVAAVGAEEAFTVVKDANDFFHDNFFGKILEKTGLMDTLLRGGDFVPPLVKGIGNTIIPRPEKLYFNFGKRISTKKYKEQFEDAAIQQIMKAKVELELLKLLQKSLKIKREHQDTNVIRKFLLKK
jgi:1-acyl-sn-glycerol-3-phosphate acyltransferase